jgi:hypothetical protein
MTDFDGSFSDSLGDQGGELNQAARSVSQLIDDINMVLVREFRDVWVYGEVTK